MPVESNNGAICLVAPCVVFFVVNCRLFSLKIALYERLLEITRHFMCLFSLHDSLT